jgi:hypothetical protein
MLHLLKLAERLATSCQHRQASNTSDDPNNASSSINGSSSSLCMESEVLYFRAGSEKGISFRNSMERLSLGMRSETGTKELLRCARGLEFQTSQNLLLVRERTRDFFLRKYLDSLHHYDRRLQRPAVVPRFWRSS